jgi:hypothetical protein
VKKFCVISGLAGGAVLVAILAIQPRPQPVAHQPAATDVSAVNTTDLMPDVSPGCTNANGFTNASIPNAVKIPARMKPEESDAQKLMDAIRTALKSGEVADWERISQKELPQLIKSDPLAAADLAQSLEAGFIREQMLRQVAHGWAAQDATAALAWAASLTDADDRNSSLTDVCVQMSQADPAAAITAAIQYGLSNQGGLYENMMQQWAAKDASAALDWANRLPPSDERDLMMARLAFVEAQVSPADAANLVAYEISSGPNQEAAALSTLHQWALQDFAGASAWADQFMEGPLQDRALQELVGIEQYRQALNN